MSIFNYISKSDLKNQVRILNDDVELLSHTNESLNQDLTTVTLERDSLKKQLDDSSNVNIELLKNMNKIQKDVITLTTKELELGDYKQRFGNLAVRSDNTDSVINEYDPDIPFFERLEKLMGNSFNNDQIKAIRYDMSKNLRIIAGAGSGKTQTICGKSAYLVQMENILESRIIMITFTKNAADELQERVNLFLGKEKSGVVVGTFHGVFKSLFSSLVKQFPYLSSIGIPGKFNDNNSNAVKEHLNTLIKKYKLYIFNNFGEKNIEQRLDYWESINLSNDEIIECIKNNFDLIDKQGVKEPIHERMKKLLYELEIFKKENELVEYKDMLSNFQKALEYSEVKNYISDRFDYLFIDEFQDTNPIQWDIVKKMFGNTKLRLIIVGDDDQSIYYFRGAEPEYIKNFDKEFPSETIELMLNYRSKKNIVHAANRLIANNSNDRVPKSMLPYSDQQGLIGIAKLNDPEEEAEWIVKKVKSLAKDMAEDGFLNIRNSIVLYRSIGQTTQLIQYLIENNIPYVINSDGLFKGIFGVDGFKWFYIHLKKYYQAVEKNQIIDAMNSLINDIFGAFYIKKQDIGEFQKAGISGSEEIAEYILNKNSRVTMAKKDIVKFFNLIKTIKRGTDTDISELFELFTKFLKISKEVDMSELEWIVNDTKKYKYWKDILSYEDRLMKEAKDMQSKLEKYNDGKLNALCLQTIHKSKGLAYDNVFVIGCYENGIPHNKAVEKSQVDKKKERGTAEPSTTIEEERRLMYVAMTRAKNNLFLTAPKNRGDKPLKLSRYLKETGIGNERN